MKVFIVVENGTAIKIIRSSDSESIISKLRELVKLDHPDAKFIPCSPELAQDLCKALVQAGIFTN